ncbi:purine-binding chemotaxis protein CheW [Aliiruegeria haliotis]|uniref:Purine-binding chemotaxis protein CheW n=1 Tax=Aliiruegeria haliotis TaxID=1280846 RepID=A0A2T0S0N7_9RHOB|nr:chemotaxis protein CheW [Aliiruegeria haliotis]PRY26997.1 purine-binding chemotaxis protein CheW [Aliiruegeria haliotis]
MIEREATHPEPTERELLSFKVGEQEYSVDIMSVREIRGWTRPTPLPHAAPFVRGVINLRGTVLPIVDLAKRLGIEVEEASERNVIIVAKVQHQTVGVLVDAVSDILAISESELQQPPEMVADAGTTFVEAITVTQGRMLRILDLDSVLPDTTKDVA